MQIKSYGIIETTKALEDNEIEFVVSTNALDAHGERIDVQGINFKEYMTNPVVLWSHDAWDLPIARATKVWRRDGKLMAKAKFDEDDPFAMKVYKKIKKGFLSAVSIGGMVDEWAEDGLTINKLTMKEFSVVSIPANPEALATAKSMTNDEKSELDEIARGLARNMLNNQDVAVKEVKRLETLVATLKELIEGQALDETNSESASNNLRVKLRTAQAVDQQAETLIKVIRKES
jgi:HK97 family phage prohead protease